MESGNDYGKYFHEKKAYQLKVVKRLLKKCEKQLDADEFDRIKMLKQVLFFLKEGAIYEKLEPRDPFASSYKVYSNDFKKELTDKFDQLNLEEQDRKPLRKYVNHELPKIREKHRKRSQIEDLTDRYQWEKEFIEAPVDHILKLMARYSAIKELHSGYANKIKVLNQDTHQVIEDGKEYSGSNMQVVILMRLIDEVFDNRLLNKCVKVRNIDFIQFLSRYNEDNIEGYWDYMRDLDRHPELVTVKNIEDYHEVLSIVQRLGNKELIELTKKKIAQLEEAI